MCAVLTQQEIQINDCYFLQVRPMNHTIRMHSLNIKIYVQNNKSTIIWKNKVRTDFFKPIFVKSHIFVEKIN